MGFVRVFVRGPKMGSRATVLAAALLSVALLLLALALLLRLLPRVASPFSGISMEGQAQWLHLVQGTCFPNFLLEFMRVDFSDTLLLSLSPRALARIRNDCSPCIAKEGFCPHSDKVLPQRFTRFS